MGARRTGEEIRRGIIDAVIEHISDRGLTSLTTVAIAKAAGIRQPNFYAYFSNVDACLEATAEHVAAEFVRMNDDAFGAIQAAGAQGSYLEVSIAYHRALLEQLMSEPRLSLLFLKHHKDDTPFGRAMRKLERSQLDKVVANLWDLGVAAGLKGEHLPQIRLLGELHIGAVYVAALSLLEGRTGDVEMVAVALAHNQDATARRTFKRLVKP